MRLHETGNNTCFDYETIRSYRKDPGTARFSGPGCAPRRKQVPVPAFISRWGRRRTRYGTGRKNASRPEARGEVNPMGSDPHRNSYQDSPATGHICQIMARTIFLPARTANSSGALPRSRRRCTASSATAIFRTPGRHRPKRNRLPDAFPVP